MIALLFTVAITGRRCPLNFGVFILHCGDEVLKFFEFFIEKRKTQTCHRTIQYDLVIMMCNTQNNCVFRCIILIFL